MRRRFLARLIVLAAVAWSPCATECVGVLGRNELDGGKVGAVALDIAREQWAALNRGVRANEEVG